MSMDKLKEAVEGIKKQYGIDEHTEVNGWLQTLIDFAQLAIDCKGFPELRHCGEDCPDPEVCTCGTDRFNEARNLCLSAHTKIMQEKILGEKEIIKIITRVYINKVYTDKPHGLSDGDIEIIARAIYDVQLEKGGENGQEGSDCRMVV